MGLCSLNSVKAYLNIQGSSSDNLISSIIDSISTMFINYCDRSFSISHNTDIMDGGTDALYTNDFPITSISGVWYDINKEWSDDTLIDSSNYVVINERYILNKYGKFLHGKHSIKVSYTSGYSTIPKDIELACIMEAARTFTEKDRLGLSSKSVTGAVDATTTYITSDFLPKTLTILDAYKKTWIV